MHLTHHFVAYELDPSHGLSTGSRVWLDLIDQDHNKVSASLPISVLEHLSVDIQQFLLDQHAQRDPAACGVPADVLATHKGVTVS